MIERLDDYILRCDLDVKRLKSNNRYIKSMGQKDKQKPRIAVFLEKNSSGSGRSVYTTHRSKLAQQRIDIKLSQKDLADLIGISRESLANIEAGRNYPKINTIKSYAKHLQISLSKLFELMGL